MRQTSIKIATEFLICRASTHSVLVAGDLMLDRYIHGEVERISPEAPVPVLRQTGIETRPGGAGNVAANLVGLGLATTLVGTVSADDDGTLLRQRLADAGVDCRLRVTTGRRTTTKTRVLGGHRQLLRIDDECTSALPQADEAALLDSALASLETCAALLLSDYGKGVLSDTLCRALIGMGRRRGIPVLVDPKGGDYARYAGATAITPNWQEAARAVDADPRDEGAVLAGAGILRARLGLDFIVVTRGEFGSFLIAPDGTSAIRTRPRAVAEVTGAGDTVLAALCAGILAGLQPADAARLANVAAGLAVEQVGAAPVQREALLAALAGGGAAPAAAWPDLPDSSDKVCTLDSLHDRVTRWRCAGESIVFTNGCFDLLHSGHVHCLEAARAQGDRLIVGLNSDDSVRALKGIDRPFVRQAERARLLGALACVDAVILFDDATPLALIKGLRPDVLVKGGDYRASDVVGAPDVTAAGGRVVIVPRLLQHSSSALAAAITGTPRTCRHKA